MLPWKLPWLDAMEVWCAAAGADKRLAHKSRSTLLGCRELVRRARPLVPTPPLFVLVAPRVLSTHGGPGCCAVSAPLLRFSVRSFRSRQSSFRSGGGRSVATAAGLGATGLKIRRHWCGSCWSRTLSRLLLTLFLLGEENSFSFSSACGRKNTKTSMS